MAEMKLETRTDLALLLDIHPRTLEDWLQILQRPAPLAEALKILLNHGLEKIFLFKNVFLPEESKELFTNLVKLLGNTMPEIHSPEKQNIILQIKKIFSNTDINHILYFTSIHPFWDFSITSRLLEYADEYYPDYTFGENIPPGMVPDIFSRSFAETLENEFQDLLNSPVDFEVIPFMRKNLNNFHVEIHYESPDFRMLRLDFSLKSDRSILESHQFFRQAGIPDYSALEKIMADNPEILYTQPSYLEVEIHSGCDYACTFCPRQYIPIPEKSIQPEALDKISSFLDQSLRDVTITLGGMGEPLLHPDVFGIFRRFLPHPALKRLIVETNGFYLETIIPALPELAEHIGKILFIINFNSIEKYETIHGAPAGALEKINRNLRDLTQVYREQNWNLEKIYIQMLKIEENEMETDAIYAMTKELGISFLLQKYNTYLDLMPQKRVSDMTPLERSFCWHLRRDIFIRADGSVSYCKQDVAGKIPVGNLKNEEIQDIFHRRQTDWIRNYRADYPENPACAVCDEYFTFNF